MAEFEIKLQEIEESGKDYDLAVAPAWLDSVLDVAELRADPETRGRARYFASLSGTDVCVRGTIRSALIAPCDRCLADVRVPIEADLTVLYTCRPKGAPASESDGEDAMDEEHYVGDTVVLDPLVRELILLELPMRVLCSEACPGIEVPESVRGPASLSDEPASPSDAVDPRLRPLLALSRGEAIPDRPKKNKKRAS